MQISLMSKQFTLDILKQLPMLLNACRQKMTLISLIFKQPEPIEKSEYKVLTAMLRFLAVCASYEDMGEVGDLCDDLFPILSSLIQGPFLKHPQLQQAKSELTLVSSACFELLTAHLNTSQYADIDQYRSFVENDCSMFLKAVMELSDISELKRLSLIAKILHFIASLLERVAKSEWHLNNTSDSIRRLERIKTIFDPVESQLQKSWLQSCIENLNKKPQQEYLDMLCGQFRIYSAAR
jgi:hypothetical protein